MPPSPFPYMTDTGLAPAMIGQPPSVGTPLLPLQLRTLLILLGPDPASLPTPTGLLPRDAFGATWMKQLRGGPLTGRRGSAWCQGPRRWGQNQQEVRPTCCPGGAHRQCSSGTQTSTKNTPTQPRSAGSTARPIQPAVLPPSPGPATGARVPTHYHSQWLQEPTLHTHVDQAGCQARTGGLHMLQAFLVGHEVADCGMRATQVCLCPAQESRDPEP